MSDTNDYTTYTADDFLQDSHFIAWMRNEDAGVNEWWLNWLALNPEKAIVVEDAREKYATLVAFNKLPADEGARMEVWDNIVTATGNDYSTGAIKKTFYLPRWFWAAASVLLIAGVAFLYLTLTRKTKEEINISAADAIKKVILEDGSMVTLNKHALLTYYKPETREVWIKGEAFFEVNKQLSKDNKASLFVVHAGEMNITVTGTSFSVANNNREVNVVLSEGSVKATAGNDEIKLKPGQKLELVDHHLEKTEVNPQLFSAWKDGEFHFDNTSLNELKDVIKDAYGASLVIKNENKIGHKLVSGVITSESREKFLLTLSILLNVNIQSKDSTIIMEPK